MALPSPRCVSITHSIQIEYEILEPRIGGISTKTYTATLGVLRLWYSLEFENAQEQLIESNSRVRFSYHFIKPIDASGVYESSQDPQASVAIQFPDLDPALSQKIGKFILSRIVQLIRKPPEPRS